MENGASGENKDPSGFLSEIIGAPVTVKLNSGVVYKGESVQSEQVNVVAKLTHRVKVNCNPSMAT